MTRCFLAADLHGHVGRYQKLLRAIRAERPNAVFLAGDLLPGGAVTAVGLAADSDFVGDFLRSGFEWVREQLADAYPRVFLILGNDDPRIEEKALIGGGAGGLWDYAHDRRLMLREYSVYGYAMVPPTPFRLKDWERYDVSRYVDPGCVSPEEGARTVPVSETDARYGTIAQDIDRLIGSDSMDKAVFLFHSPPYETRLDRAAMDGKMIDHVPLDVHVGSIAIRRMIEQRQPLLTLHGHIHESARLTRSWRDRIGRTHLFSAAHDGPELALVRFDLEALDEATRELM